MFASLAGYRTHIMTGGAILSSALLALKMIDVDTWLVLMGIFVPGSASFLRMAVENLQKSVKKEPPTMTKVERE